MSLAYSIANHQITRSPNHPITLRIVMIWAEWRCACSAAWKSRPRTVDGRRPRPTSRASSSVQSGVVRTWTIAGRLPPERAARELRRSAGGVRRDFRVQHRTLRGVQRLAAGVQSAGGPGSPPDGEMEANRRRASRFGPQLCQRDGRARRDLLADLHERMSNGLKFGNHIRHRAAQPDFEVAGSLIREGPPFPATALRPPLGDHGA